MGYRIVGQHARRRLVHGLSGGTSCLTPTVPSFNTDIPPGEPFVLRFNVIGGLGILPAVRHGNFEGAREFAKRVVAVIGHTLPAQTQIKGAVFDWALVASAYDGANYVDKVSIVCTHQRYGSPPGVLLPGLGYASSWTSFQWECPANAHTYRPDSEFREQLPGLRIEKWSWWAERLGNGTAPHVGWALPCQPEKNEGGELICGGLEECPITAYLLTGSCATYGRWKSCPAIWDTELEGGPEAVDGKGRPKHGGPTDQWAKAANLFTGDLDEGIYEIPPIASPSLQTGPGGLPPPTNGGGGGTGPGGGGTEPGGGATNGAATSPLLWLGVAAGVAVVGYVLWSKTKR